MPPAPNQDTNKLLLLCHYRDWNTLSLPNALNIISHLVTVCLSKLNGASPLSGNQTHTHTRVRHIGFQRITPLHFYSQSALTIGIIRVVNHTCTRFLIFVVIFITQDHREVNKTAAVHTKRNCMPRTNTYVFEPIAGNCALRAIKCTSAHWPYLHSQWWLLWTGLSNCWFLPAKPGWFSLSACPQCSAKAQRNSSMRLTVGKQQTPASSMTFHHAVLFNRLIRHLCIRSSLVHKTEHWQLDFSEYSGSRRWTELTGWSSCNIFLSNLLTLGGRTSYSTQWLFPQSPVTWNVYMVGFCKLWLWFVKLCICPA